MKKGRNVKKNIIKCFSEFACRKFYNSTGMYNYISFFNILNVPLD